MSAPRRDASGETRWWKLNTRRYGGRLLAAAGVCALIAAALSLFGLALPAKLLFALAAFLAVLVFMLVRIELWQDERDNARYQKEEKDQ